MRTEIIKGIVSLIITILIVIIGGLSSPFETYTNTTNLLFSNKELIMVILVFVVFILKNIRLSMMIYTSRRLTIPYLFFFINNVCINLLLFLMLLETNKITLLLASIIVSCEFIIASSHILAGGFVHNVSFSSRNIRVKEFLCLMMIVALVLDGMPFALESWPIAMILMIVYVIYIINLTINNIYILSKEI